MAVAKATRLLGEERRRKILEYLERDGRVTVDRLVKSLAVSAVTVRGDLDALSRAGSLVRSHGGRSASAESGAGLSGGSEGDHPPRREGAHRTARRRS